MASRKPSTPRKPRNGRSVKNRGSTYERELAAYLTETLGIEVRRMVLSGGGQTFGGAGHADLTGTPFIHVEAKRTNRLSLSEAMAQAERSLVARQCPDFPVIISRPDNVPTGKSWAIMRLDAWLILYAAFLARHGLLPLEEAA